MGAPFEQLLTKLPNRPNAIFPMHQDMAYWPKQSNIRTDTCTVSLALNDAGISTSEVGYINAHGTSTYFNDMLETQAIKKVLGNDAKNVSISSTKSMTGHLLGAAGAIEAIASILAIKNSCVPPTINLENLDEQLDPKINYTANKIQKKNVKNVISNTFGFGGHNATVLLGKL